MTRLVVLGMLTVAIAALVASFVAPHDEPEVPAQPRTPVTPSGTATSSSAEGAEAPGPPASIPTVGPVPVGRRAPRADTAPAFSVSARRDPEAAVRAYAAQYLNWTHRTIARQYRRLALLSAGALQMQNRAAADDTAAHEALARDDSGARGRIEHVEIIARSSGSVRLGVHSRERYYGSTGGAVRGAVRGRYQARVVRQADGTWRIVAWQPRL